MIEYYLFSFHQTCSAHILHKYSCLASLSVGMAYLQRSTRSKMGSLSPTTQGGKLRQREAHRKPGASLGVGQKRKMSGSGHHFSTIKSLREVCKNNLGTQLPSKPMRTGHLRPAINFFKEKKKKNQQQRKAVLRGANMFRQSGSQNNCLKSQMNSTSTLRYLRYVLNRRSEGVKRSPSE